MNAVALMSLTDRAAERVKILMAQNDKPIAGLRIGVNQQGCSGFTYQMDYAETQAPTDTVIEDKGVTLFIDAEACLYLAGTQMDWVEDKLASHFTFNNPNEKGRCGCGSSFHV